MTLIDKSRPELGHDTKSAAKVRTVSAKRDAAKGTMPGHDPSRQDLGTQIRQLRESMNRDLRRIANLVHAGRMDKAAMVAGLAANKRALIQERAAKLGAISLSASHDDVPILRKPATKTTVKVRRYARWSDK